MFLRATDARARKDLGVLLDDTITKIGHTNIWENVRDIVVQYTKMAQWLGDQENWTTEHTLRPIFVAEDHQARAWETMVEKGIEVTAVE